MNIIDRNRLVTLIFDSSSEVHKILGPGLEESIYKACFNKELSIRNINFKSNIEYSVIYKNFQLNNTFAIDFIVENEIIVFVIATESVNYAHTAKLNTALHLTGKKIGILINFNVPKLVDGFKKIAKNENVSN